MPQGNTLNFNITAETQQAQAQITDLNDQITTLTESTQEATEQATEGFAGFGASLEEVGAKFGPVLAGLAGIGATLAVLKETVDSMVAWQKAVSKANELSAVGQKTAAGFALALKQTGFEADDATGALQAFAIRFQEAKVGGEDATNALKLFITDANQLKQVLDSGDVGEALLQVADNMERIGATSERAFALDTLLGGESEKFVQFASGLRQTADEAERLGLVFGPDKQAQVKQYTKDIGALEGQWEALKIKVGAAVLPAITDFFGVVNEELKGNRAAWDYFKASIDATVGRLIDASNQQYQTNQEQFKGAQILRETTEETRKEIEAYAAAIGITAEQAAFWTAGSPKALAALKAQREATAAARAEQEKLTQATKDEATALRLASQEKQKAADTAQQIADRAQKDAEKATAAVGELQRQGELDTLQAAERLAKIKVEPYQKEVAAADAAFYALKAQRAAGEIAETEYRTKLIEIGDRMDAARAARNEAARSAEDELNAKYAEKRAGDLAAYQKELDTALKSELDAIDKRKTSYLGAEQAKIEAAGNRIQQEIDLLDKQLTSERVTAEEKKQLLAQVDALQAQYSQIQEERGARLAEAERRDTAEYYNQQSELADEKIAKTELEIAQAQRRGATEQEVAVFVARAKQAEIAAIDVAISRAEAEGESQTRILRLKADRERAELELAQAHATASAQIIAGEEAQQAAIQETTDAVNAGRQAQEANVAGAIDFIASLTAYAQGATRETIDEMEANLQKALTEAANTMAALGAGQIAGLLEYYGQQAQAAFGEIQKKREEFEKEDAAARAAARKAEEERAVADAQREQERINSEIEKAKADAQRAENQRRKQERANAERFQEDLKQITVDGLEAIQGAEENLADIRVRQAEDEAERLLQVEKDLQASREKAILDSQQKAADDEASRVEREIEAKRKLAEAQASGDIEGAEEAQGELSDIEAERDREERRAEEEALARQQATSEEELAILLEAIDEKFSREEDFYARKKALGENATEEEREATEAAYQAQLAAIQAAKQAQLDELAAQKAEEERLRQEARAKELADAQQAITDAKSALDQQLTARKDAYAAQQEEFDRAAEKERNAHAKLMADLEAQARASFEKMGEYARGYFSELDKGTAPGAGGSTAGGGGGTGGGGNQAGGGSPAASPPPPPNTQTDSGNQTGGSGGRGRGRGQNGGNATDDAYNLAGTLSGAEQRAYQANLDACQKAIAEYKTGKTTFDQAFAVVKGLFDAKRISVSDFADFAQEIDTIRKEQEKKGLGIADDITKPGDLGALTTTGPGRESPGPPATNTTPPASAPPPKAERDPVVASNLEFKADNIRTKNDREAVIEAANKALELGKIDQQDMGRIKSHADFQSFQAGVDIGGGGNFSSGGTTSLQAVGGAGGSGGGIRPVSAASGSTPAPAGASAIGNQLLGGVAPGQKPLQIGQIVANGSQKDEIINDLIGQLSDAIDQAGIT